MVLFKFQNSLWEQTKGRLQLNSHLGFSCAILHPSLIDFTYEHAFYVDIESLVQYTLFQTTSREPDLEHIVFGSNLSEMIEFSW